MDDEIITEADAATITKDSETVFRRRRYRGEGPRFIRVGKKVLYKRSSVLDWLDSLEVSPAESATK